MPPPSLVGQLPVITCANTRSRLGVISAERALMYSWRLIMAPPEVLDYVAAHEVAHLGRDEPFGSGSGL